MEIWQVMVEGNPPRGILPAFLRKRREKSTLERDLFFPILNQVTNENLEKKNLFKLHSLDLNFSGKH